MKTCHLGDHPHAGSSARTQHSSCRDGTAGTFVVQRLVFAGSGFTLPIYGHIPQRQDIPIGLYTDSVIVRLDV